MDQSQARSRGGILRAYCIQTSSVLIAGAFFFIGQLVGRGKKKRVLKIGILWVMLA